MPENGCMKRSPYQFWLDRGKQLVGNLDYDQFELGDWVNEGLESGRIKNCREAAEKLNERLKPTTLKTYAWVSKQFPQVIRITGLSFAHHQVLARISQENRADLADKARQNRWSVSRLRTEVRKKTINKAKPDSDDERERKRLRELMSDVGVYAKHCGQSRTSLLLGILVDYFNQPAVKNELAKAKAENRQHGAPQTWRDKAVWLDDLCARTANLESGTDPGRIVREYERTWGEKFPFDFAMSRTAFGDHFGDLTREDCGID